MIIPGSSFEQTVMGWSPKCYITSFLEISPPVMEKKNFEGFYHKWAWRPSWSCDPDTTMKLLFPLPKEATYTLFGLIGQAVSEEKIFENVNGRRTGDGPLVSYKLTYEASAKVS